MQVFISHSMADRDLARRLANQLQRVGLTAWNPSENILPGDNWAKEIGDALESSDVMVVLLSKHGAVSSNLRQEVQYALTSGHYQSRVVPVLIGWVTYEAGKDVPWILLKMDPIHLEDSSPDFTPVVERVQNLARAGSNASE